MGIARRRTGWGGRAGARIAVPFAHPTDGTASTISSSSSSSALGGNEFPRYHSIPSPDPPASENRRVSAWHFHCAGNHARSGKWRKP